MADLPASFDAFQRECLAQGYDEVLVRNWAPGTVVASHTHPFTAHAVIVQGEMWLDGRHLVAGEGFDVPAHTVHDERYGAEGATFWVARRQG